MLKKIAVFTLIIIFHLFSFYLESADSGKEIMEKFYNRKVWPEVKMDIEMTLVNRRGRKRVRNFVLYSKYFGDCMKSLFEFTSPASVKGIRFLSFDRSMQQKSDERWMYMPSLKKIQRVSGTSRNDYFMGSDLTYHDLTKRDVNKAVHKLIEGSETNSKFWIVRSKPEKNYDIYSEIVTKIRKKSLIPEEIKFFGKDGKLVKIMKLIKAEKIKGIWLMRKFEMKNVIKNHKTILEIKKISFDYKFRDEIFSPKRFSRTRL